MSPSPLWGGPKWGMEPARTEVLDRAILSPTDRNHDHFMS